MASVRVKDLPKRETGEGISPSPYVDSTEYLNLLANALSIEGLDFKKARFAIEELLTAGNVGYDSITKSFYSLTTRGRDEEGDPTSAIFHTRNGKSFFRDLTYEPSDDGAYYIRSLPIEGITFSDIIAKSCDFITLCDLGVYQNLKACMTPYIVAVKDKDTLLSVRQALQQKQDGQAVLIVSEGLSDSLSSTDIGVDFLADRYVELREGERDRLLKKLGIVTDITKGERVQTSEVDANVCQASDYIYMLIDTFNKQCEQYGLPFKMKANGTFEELYTEPENNAEQPQEDTMND